MIKNSFIFLEKIGTQSEKNLWQQGINNWDSFLKKEKISRISKAKLEYYKRRLKEASEALIENDYDYFKRLLPKKELWRLYPELKDHCCFLDLEIDSCGKIVLVGISNYYQTNFFVSGVNLEQEFLKKELAKYKLIITYNGSSFDLPKLRKQLRLDINLLHIDLKPLCVNLGLVGGLKEVEKILNLKRPAHLYGSPVDLWQAFHASGDREYLDLLIDYNREDVENLKLVMEYVFRKEREKLYKEINSA